MDAQQAKARLEALNEVASRYWAGEAEIVRAFFSQPRSKEDHIRWLRLQCYKELYGSGIVPFPEGLILGPIEHLRKTFALVDIKVDRHEYEHLIQVLHEEFTHYCLMADILDELTGGRTNPQELQQYQYLEDKKLKELRDRFRHTEGELGELAVEFTEGGRAAIFQEGMQLKGNPLLEKIARACRTIFDDEVGHQEYGAARLERVARTEEDWDKAQDMVVAISKQRIRMRDEQFSHSVSRKRFWELEEGNAEP